MAVTVSSVTPAQGPSGTLVIITGTGFSPDTVRRVKFGAVDAGPNFQVVDDTAIACLVPYSASGGTVSITVYDDSGSGSGGTFLYDANVGDPGSTSGAAPTVTGVSPSTATTSDGGEDVTITGTGFTTALEVYFGSAQASFVVNSDTSITAISPPGSGTVDVSVTNLYGMSAITAADHYTYPTLPVPAVTSISPQTGLQGSSVTITGTNLDYAEFVTFGDEYATFDILSPTSIKATVPDGPSGTTVDVLAGGLGGWGDDPGEANDFTYAMPTGMKTTATNVQQSPYTGWSRGSVTVSMSASSGGGAAIAATYYRVDSGAITQYTAPFTVSDPGCHLIQYWSVDVQGVVEPTNTGYVNILSDSNIPSGLTATAAGLNQVLVKWTSVVSDGAISYKVYQGSTSNPTTLVATTSANVVVIPQAYADGAKYYAVSSVNAIGVESPKSAAVGPVTAVQVNHADIAVNAVWAEQIMAGSITAAKLNVADVQAAVVTAAQINSLNLTAVNISGGNINGVTITGTTFQLTSGGVFRTAASGVRVEITGVDNDKIRFYDAYTYAQMQVWGDSSASNFYIQGPERRLSGITSSASIAMIGTTSYPRIEIEANDCKLTIGTSSGNNRFDGPLLVFGGGIRPGTNFVSGTSEDGIWIQDSATTSQRWKLYFDSSTKRLYVRRDSSTYSYIAVDASGGY